MPRHPDNVKLAYFAGLFDGEGSITIRKPNGKNPRAHYLRVTIANSNPKPLKLIKKFFGGSLNKYIPKNGKQPSYILTLSCKKAHNFLEDIYPYLIIKRNIAWIAICFRKLIPRRGATRDKYGKMLRVSDEELETREAVRLLIQKMNRRYGKYD